MVYWPVKDVQMFRNNYWDPAEIKVSDSTWTGLTEKLKIKRNGKQKFFFALNP